MRLYDEYYSKASVVENEPARRALQWLFDLMQAHAMPSPIDPAGGWEAQLWTQGRVGMMNWIGYWFSGALRMWAPENEDIRALMEVARMKPSFTWGPKNIVVSNGPTADAITATTRYPEQSWRLLKCFIAGYLGEKRAASGWGLPPVKSNMKLIPSDTDFDKRLNATLDAAIKRGQTMPHQNPFYSSDTFGQLWVAEVEKALGGSQTFDEKVNQVISEGVESMTR